MSDLSFARLIKAPQERVFDAFTSPDGQRELYGQDTPGWIVESRCDLRVGGVWETRSARRPASSTTTGTSSRRSTARTGSASPRPRPVSTGRRS
jgi:uncharacterized protein YndB with AHSA1/START domain